MYFLCNVSNFCKNVLKNVFVLFCSVVIMKNRKTWFLEACRNQIFFTFFNILQLKNNKKFSAHTFVDIVKENICASLQKKRLNKKQKTPLELELQEIFIFETISVWIKLNAEFFIGEPV